MIWDINGKLSGKRIGALLLILAAIFVSIWGIITKADLLGTAALVGALAGPACALLGVTVKERKEGNEE